MNIGHFEETSIIRTQADLLFHHLVDNFLGKGDVIHHLDDGEIILVLIPISQFSLIEHGITIGVFYKGILISKILISLYFANGTYRGAYAKVGCRVLIVTYSIDDELAITSISVRMEGLASIGKYWRSVRIVFLIIDVP